MYLKHFALTRYPFSKEIEADALFGSSASTELETRLGHLIELRGMGLITGESGSGKTTVCRKVVSKLHVGLYRVFYVTNSTGHVMDLYKAIAWELGLPVERSRAALYRVICAEVTRLCLETHMRPVLVIDEAQLLRSDVLDELRLLTNYEMDSMNRLCLVLVGHPELRRRLGMAVHEAINQRIVVRHHVPGLTQQEVGDYLRHLLRLAGRETPLFEAAAVLAIFQASGGLPRKVGLLAHHALIAAALAQAQIATAEHVQAALSEVS